MLSVDIFERIIQGMDESIFQKPYQLWMMSLGYVTNNAHFHFSLRRENQGINRRKKRKFQEKKREEMDDK